MHVSACWAVAHVSCINVASMAVTTCSIAYLFLHPPPPTNIQVNCWSTMPSNASKKPSTVPKSPPKPHRSGRKHARSSLDATVAPPSKKVAVEKVAVEKVAVEKVAV